jgi:hypothetical protein
MRQNKPGAEPGAETDAYATVAHNPAAAYSAPQTPYQVPPPSYQGPQPSYQGGGGQQWK